jgi:hypothetical protein
MRKFRLARELQKHPLRSLPNRTVPGLFVRLQTIPLSRNGKLDLTMLEYFKDTLLLKATRERVPPPTSTEEKVLTLIRGLPGSAIGRGRFRSGRRTLALGYAARVYS